MKGYSKIKGNNSFIPRSNSKKEFLFLDKDFELLSSKSLSKKTQIHEEQEQKPRIIFHEDDHHNKYKKNESFFLAKTEDHDDDDDGGDDQYEKSKSNSNGGVLKRNSSVSYQKKNNVTNNSKNISFERQSSTRAIQEAVKRAFSITRSSSVNSDRYSRIYDQPNISISMNVDECDYAYDNHHLNHDDNHVNYGNQDYDFERIGSLETRSMKKNQDSYGRKHVGSKVVRACKRLFSR